MATPRTKKQASISRFFSPKTSVKRRDAFPPSPAKRPDRAEPDAETGPTETVPELALAELTPKPNTAPAKPYVSRKNEKPKPPKLTPLEQQYTQLKKENPDKLLAIQVGYKYKFFGEDAVVASLLLNIMLIPGNLKVDERAHDRFAYCLIPDVRLHIHLQRLLNHGFKVGVVKQTESAAIKNVESNKSSLFLRRVTAVYTKATYMGDENGEKTETENDAYIMCVYRDANINIVAVHPATGEIIYDVCATRDDLDTRLACINPSEVIVIDDNMELKKALCLQNPHVSVKNAKRLTDDEVLQSLALFFSLADADHLPEYFHLKFPPGILACVAELILYLAEFKLSNIFTVTSNMCAFSDLKTFMVLPAGTLRALDVFQVQEDPAAKKGTLMWLLDNTVTRSGAKMLRKWVSRPLVQKKDIESRLNAVETLVSGNFVHVIDAFRGALVKVGKSGVEIDRSLTKIHYSATQENDRVSRKEIYLMLRSLGDIMQVFRDFGPASLAEFLSQFPEDKLILELLEQMLKYSDERAIDGLLGQIDPGVALSGLDVSEMKQRFFNLDSDPKFAGVLLERECIQHVENDLHTQLLDIRKYLNRPQLQYVSVLKDTHLIEVRNGKQTDALPKDWLKISATKSVSRYRPAKVSLLHQKLQYHTEKLINECDKCFKLFLREIDTHHEYIRQIVTCLSTFDCLLSLAAAAKSEILHVKPEVVDSQIIRLKQSSHPILLRIGPYVPNDIDVSYDQNRVLIITGPNMGGKSSLVKQIALSVIMAQVGCFLPCAGAQIGVFDLIHIRMGASDNILKGKSTFMVEMQECASIVLSYTEKSLVILDEIGRGTGTKDGVSLAYAILKYIIEDEKSPTTLFITHYPSLHVLENEHDAVNNYHMAFIERGEQHDWPEVIFLYKVVRGVVSNSYGLNVAKLAGIEKKVIDAAYEVSEKMKHDFEGQRLLKRLSEIDKSQVFDSLEAVLRATDK